MKPKVTIITVCFNAVDVIENTIKSVINQTYSNIEYIIVDGASTDGTIQIINKYKNYISKIVSEPDNGIYDAMNKGISISTGYWINFMNAGDTFADNDVIEKVFLNKIDINAGLIYGDVIMKYNDKPDIIKRLNNLKKGKVQYSLNHQSTFTLGSFLREEYYDTTFKIAADANSFNRLFKNGYSLIYVPLVIAKYDSTNGVSSKRLFPLFCEFAKIKEENPFKISWWKGLIKTVIMLSIMFFFSEKKFNSIMYKYVSMRIKNK